MCIASILLCVFLSFISQGVFFWLSTLGVTATPSWSSLMHAFFDVVHGHVGNAMLCCLKNDSGVRGSSSGQTRQKVIHLSGNKVAERWRGREKKHAAFSFSFFFLCVYKNTIPPEGGNTWHICGVMSQESMHMSQTSLCITCGHCRLLRGVPYHFSM